MSIYAYGGPAWAEIPAGGEVEIAGVVHSHATVLLWSDDERAAAGIREIAEAPVPAGKIVTGSSLVDQAGEPRRVWTLEDEPIEEMRERLSQAVYAERNRRLAAGFEHDFGDGRGVHLIGTTPSDMAGWDEVTKWSDAAIALGQSGAAMTILTGSGPAEVTALEWKQVLLAATAFRQPIWHHSFALLATVAAAEDRAAFDVVEVETGWPE